MAPAGDALAIDQEPAVGALDVALDVIAVGREPHPLPPGSAHGQPPARPLGSHGRDARGPCQGRTQGQGCTGSSRPCSDALSWVRLVAASARLRPQRRSRKGPRASAWSSLSAASDRTWLPGATTGGRPGAARISASRGRPTARWPAPGRRHRVGDRRGAPRITAPGPTRLSRSSRTGYDASGRIAVWGDVGPEQFKTNPCGALPGGSQDQGNTDAHATNPPDQSADHVVHDPPAVHEPGALLPDRGLAGGRGDDPARPVRSRADRREHRADRLRARRPIWSASRR